MELLSLRTEFAQHERSSHASYQKRLANGGGIFGEMQGGIVESTRASEIRQIAGRSTVDVAEGIQLGRFCGGKAGYWMGISLDRVLV